MSDITPQAAPTPVQPARKPVLERWLEEGLFQSRWLMAPFYVGLIGALIMLLIAFGMELVHAVPLVTSMSPEDVILVCLSLIDLSLAGNLLLIVIFSGYENFVSKIDTADHSDRPEWMGTVDYSGLKMKLIASIVAISAISLLKSFMKLSEPGAEIDQIKLMWLVITHLTFVVSGVLMAAMDWMVSRTRAH